MRFFFMSPGSFSPKNSFLGQKVCPVARVQTYTEVTTLGILSGFQEFFLQPIIKDWSKYVNYARKPKTSTAFQIDK